MHADDELLAGAHAQVLPARGEVGLRLGDEAVAHRLELAPVLRIGEELPEGEQRVALLVELAEDAQLYLVELDVVSCLEPPAASVREDPVVELVGRPDARSARAPSRSGPRGA